MLKKIVLALVALIAVFVVVGLLLPRQVHVERSVEITRPASLVYAVVNSFQLFPKWSPWQDLDPNVHQTTEGPREGVGATLRWSGNDKVGTGSQVITASVPDQSVRSDLDFGKMGIAKAAILLNPSGAATQVTWTLDTDMGAGPVGRYFGLMMDKMIGKDYEAGLFKLKMLVESLPDADIGALTVETVDLKAMPVLLVSETSAPDPAAIGKAYADGFARIGRFMAKNALHQAGAPLGIDTGMSDTAFSFQAGIPIDRTDVTGADGVQVAQSYAGKALKTLHVGPYDGLDKTYKAFRAYLAAHDYSSAGAPIAWYIDDPGKTPPEQLRTEIFWPIG